MARQTKTVLVTGASAGIGHATCLYLAGKGYSVIATGRDMGRLEGLLTEAGSSGLPVHGVELDVNDLSKSRAQSAPRETEKRGGCDAPGRVRRLSEIPYLSL